MTGLQETRSRSSDTAKGHIRYDNYVKHVMQQSPDYTVFLSLCDGTFGLKLSEEPHRDDHPQDKAKRGRMFSRADQRRTSNPSRGPAIASPPSSFLSLANQVASVGNARGDRLDPVDEVEGGSQDGNSDDEGDGGGRGVEITSLRLSMEGVFGIKGNDRRGPRPPRPEVDNGTVVDNGGGFRNRILDLRNEESQRRVTFKVSQSNVGASRSSEDSSPLTESRPVSATSIFANIDNRYNTNGLRGGGSGFGERVLSSLVGRSSDSSN